MSSNFFLYLPYPIECINNCTKTLTENFKEDVNVITKLSFEKEINFGILWIDTHGIKRETNGKDFLLLVKQEDFKPEYQKYLVVNQSNGKVYLPSIYLPIMFNVKNSIIIMDNCYSSEIDIKTLSTWKSNLIFTTGYIRDYYTEVETGMIKAIRLVFEELKKRFNIDKFDYITVLQYKDLINKGFEEINKKFNTEYNLF